MLDRSRRDQSCGAILLRNAQAHGTPGSTELRFSSEPGLAVIEVSNAGPEFTAEELNQLKEPFTRGNNRVSGSGHGLGLALVDAIAASHHGQLDLAPRPGGGVIARLSIPRGLSVSPRRTPRQAAD
ncbi:two-component system, OmpR family, sensor histidine kinase VanS [Corynebacterium appendicis CIP 107643]|uniref:histidine kinase n=1 Tax=Corynebacterium appendicis CIP 107643 TaxID=1161099 RepID=A0A1N7J0W5_9CORY|nr:ATP-binding protein [Corynebacterium appendicis]WJY61480.1 Osmolarity sensor protein EnvZ [Corynebacterium appendicis CIP 107643]SIS42960.1 two-component system, OmpR family, sensor histidine kinase VanS [Corynebacterium appendicis CIP 107643]